jgi:hypothetical protein
LDKDSLKEISPILKIIEDSSEKSQIEFPNINYWFSAEAQDELFRIKRAIESHKEQLTSDMYHFLLVCFSSIIRKSSNADPYMGKTYRSKSVVKRIASGWKPTPIQYFKDAVLRNCERLSCTFDGKEIHNSSQAIQGDAKEISSILAKEGINLVDMIVTSPPYINAQDYFRSYKLELWWLGLATPEQVIALNKKAIGTEYVATHDYTSAPETDCALLNEVLVRIWSKSEIGRRKSYMVANYFNGMSSFFNGVEKLLPKGKYFCLITGNNTICEEIVPTYKILTNLAEQCGFKLDRLYRDEIKWRVLFKKRNHNGGVINEEWITVFKKNQ